MSRSTNRAIAILTVVLAVLLVLVPRAEAGTQTRALLPQSMSTTGARLLASGERGISFQVSLASGDLNLEPISAGSEDYVQASVPGWAATQEPGAPQIPSVEILLGVPFGVEVEIQVDPGEASIIALPAAVLPVVTERVEWDLDVLTKEGPALPSSVTDLLPAAKIYDSKKAYPGVLAEIANDGVIRQQRVVGVAVYPIQYIPASALLNVYADLTVHIRFVGGADSQPILTAEPESPTYEDLFRTELLNYESARQWRRQPATSTAAAPWVPPLPGYKIAVQQAGVYRMTYAYLLGAGLPVDSLDPRQFQLFNQGAEVAIYVAGETDGHFDATDYVLFYGQAINSKYTRDNVYWLTYGQATGLRMSSRDGTPSSGTTPAAYETVLHRETNASYLPSALGGDDLERFFWDYVYPPYQASWSHSVSLPWLAPGAYSATLTLELFGFIDNPVEPDHHTQVYVNGNLVEDWWWDGITWYTSVISFPQTYLVAGNNTIRVTSPNDTGLGYDLAYVDWLDLAFASLFTATNDILTFEYDAPGMWKYQAGGFSTSDIAALDVSMPGAVERIVGGVVSPAGSSFTLLFSDQVSAPTRYWIGTTAQYLTPVSIQLDEPSSLESPANGADYIIITPSEFYINALVLRDYRAAQGLRAVQVDVQDVYDQFGYGITGVRPIHDFLEYTLTQWQAPAPTYVLLVGDGHYDPKNYLGLNRPTYILPYLAAVDPWIVETASDNRYVTLTEPDTFPDMIVGRLPANSQADIDIMIDHVVDYEGSPPAGDWNQSLLFVADNADSAGDFVDMSESLIDCCLPAPYQQDKVYYLVTHTTPAQARAAIVSGITAGQLIVNYIGHGAFRYWASEEIFRTADLPLLGNGDMLPIMLPMTCYDGHFHFPYDSIQSMGESIVRIAGKGAVASWSPTGKGVASGHDFLDRGFFDAVFAQGARSLGQATMAGKLRLWATGGSLDLVDTYVLFGDPALHINALDTDMQVTKTVEPEEQLKPGDTVTYTLAFTNAGPAMAFGVTLSDAIPVEFVNLEVVTASPEVIAPLPGITFAWTITDLLPGQSGWVQVRAEVGPLTQSHTVVNLAEISSHIPDTDTLNNTSAVESFLRVPDADLQLVKTVEPAGQVRSGDVLTYTLSFANSGPDPASGVILTDILPLDLVSPTVIYASPEVISQHIGITFAWTITDLLPGTNGLIQVRGVVSPTAQPGFVLVNRAELRAVTADLVPGNNVVTVTTGVQVPDVAVWKTGPAAVAYGQALTYTLAWGNLGPVAASSVRLTDTLPAWVSYVADSSGWPHTEPAPGVIVWEVMPDPVPTGTLETFVVTGWVTMDPAMAGPLVNQVHIKTGLADGNPDNDQSEWSTDLLLPDLVIDKTGPAVALARSEISYTLSYANAGDLEAAGVLITDTLPSGVTYLGDDSGLAHSEPQPGVHVWQVAPSPLLPGAGDSFAVWVQVGDYSTIGTSLDNQAAIGAGLPDGNWADNQAGWTTDVPRPDLAIGLSGPDTAAATSIITYTLAYSNLGLGPAWGAIITDLLPAGVTYVRDDSGLAHSEPQPGSHVWQVVPDPALGGSSGGFHLVVQLGTLGQTGSPITNRVSIGAQSPDSQPANNAAEWSTLVGAQERVIYLPLVVKSYSP